MARHIRQSCKLTSSSNNTERQAEFTLQRQLADQAKQIAELTDLVKSLAAKSDALPGAGSPTHITQTNIATQNNVQIQIVPWDGDRRIEVGIGHIAAAFTHNTRLKEYMKLGDRDLASSEIAPPYVIDLFMDLIRRAHADPAARNVYLNPKRADQTLVRMRSGRWEILPLQEATRLLFDGVAGVVHAVTCTSEERKQLPLEAQNALSLAGLLYEEEPDEYVRRAQQPMAAHLANTGPIVIPQG